MRIFQFVLFAVCMGLLGAVAMIAGLPRAEALSQRRADYLMRPQITETLDRAVHLADAHNYSDALRLVDDANAFSDKTNVEVQEINQVHDFVLNRQRRPWAVSTSHSSVSFVIHEKVRKALRCWLWAPLGMGFTPLERIGFQPDRACEYRGQHKPFGMAKNQDRKPTQNCNSSQDNQAPATGELIHAATLG
jgi:hypothetical protein